jgi:hypothetical protein
LAPRKCGRGAGRCGEDGSEISGVDFFLELRGGATGAAPGDGDLRELALSSIYCMFWTNDGFRGCVGSRGGV